jgi:type 1 glutamine amidotransferase
MADSFEYESEQYYMMTDPGNEVLATTVYEHEDKKVVMPVVWTKNWKAGKVFYSALGHSSKEFIEYPEVLAMTIRGMKWAAR